MPEIVCERCKRLKQNYGKGFVKSINKELSMCKSCYQYLFQKGALKTKKPKKYTKEVNDDD